MALNMADIFEHAVDAFPERVAVICGERQVTYRELEDEANRLAHHLAAQGVGPGGHVGLYAHNSVETVATLLAAIKLRAVAININFRYLEGELAYHLRDSDLCALVHDQELAPIVDAVVSLGLPRVSIGGSDDEWSQSRAGAEDDGMVRMAPAPLIHGAAMVATLACLFIGDTAVILPRFDPHAVWAAVQRHQVNVLSIIGDAMARPLMEALAAGDYDTSSLISLNSTAALFSPAVKEACAKALPNAYISEAIGSTETGFAGLAFVNADDEHRGGPTVNAGPDVIVIDEAGAVCGPGQTGKLARGGHVPLGYYKDPVKTAEMFTEVNGRRYAAPGDWARVEDDGAITMLGRGN